MKKLYTILALSGILLFSACSTTQTAGRSGKVPPGQAKKHYGSKSAKHHAPGQKKKHNKH